MKSGSDVLASIYPGESYIVMGTTNNSSGSVVDSVPMNVNLGDLVYVSGSCNTSTYFNDLDNGDGTCTTYTCKPGELDMADGRCKPFTCGTTNNGFSTITDTNNNDGTCTKPIVYNGCNGSDTYNATLNSCNATLPDRTTIQYLPPTSAAQSRYDVTINGVAGTAYTKNSTNQSYKYSKTLGPYVVAMSPSTNKIMIKSFTAGDLDLSGNFKLNPTAAWRRLVKAFSSSSVGVTQGSPSITSVSSALSGSINTALFNIIHPSVIPAVVTTADLNAVPEGGYTNGKLYKVLYNDGLFLGSYTSIRAGTNAGNLQTTFFNNSIKIDSITSSTQSRFSINGINLLIGQKYILTVSVKSTVACTMYLESAANQYYTLGDLTPSAGSTSTSISTTTSFSQYIWSFYAVTTAANFYVVKPSTATVTFEFNRLDIQGGVVGPTRTLACRNGSTTTAGVTKCNP
jgi:hypothetical protein